MPIGSLIGSFFTGAIQQGISSAFQPGGIFGGGGFTPTSQPTLPAPPSGVPTVAGATVTPTGGVTTALSWAARMLRRYGPIIGQIIIDVAQQRQLEGLEEREAQTLAERQYGRRKRRRMNVTNVRAARRAVRRLRGFKRVSRKVNRLLGSRVVVRSGAPRRRRYRGDILPFEHNGGINPFAAEDYADYADELEDLGYEVPFRDDEGAEE